jgi:hypothetical protein
MATKKIIHFDKKIITPEDYVKASFSKRKPIIGKPKVFINDQLVADEENLVVLTGREFFAQKVTGYAALPTKDYRNYEIRYFGVGSGGAAGTSVSDPQDSDTDLAQIVQIAPSTEANTIANGYKYIDKGAQTAVLKRINYDAYSQGSDNPNWNGVTDKIIIAEEEHEINTADGQVVTQTYYTAIKFILEIDENEIVNKPFTFNEAGLFAVKINDDGTPDPNNVLMVARFTTTDKNLGPNDGLRIEWTVLV